MDINEMTVKQLKEYLDEREIDYSDAKVKDDFIAIAEQAATKTEKPSGVAALVQSAIKIEKETTKVKADPLDYLKDRDYSQLSVGERAIIREQSPEYESVDEGVLVFVTDRLTTDHRIVKLADGKFAKLVKGTAYTLAQVDFDMLSGLMVKVKTIATQNKCCGQARYEDVALIEVTNA